MRAAQVLLAVFMCMGALILGNLLQAPWTLSRRIAIIIVGI